MANKNKITGFICGPKIYKYSGILFEWHIYCGPAQLKKDGELYKNYCSKKFIEKIDKFIKMSDKERKKFRVRWHRWVYAYIK
jgi:hypothetical protein